jgi:5-methyltetrahydrofolate--homocysteine methyltransferase
MSAEVADLNRRAAEAAQQAAQAAETVVVAGSMGPTGGLLEPLGELTHEQIVDIYAEQAGALARGGVDVFWIETMSDLGELRAAVEGARQADADTPIAATMTFDTAGHTMMGVSPEKAMEAMLALDLVALGANCGNGVEEIETVIEKMHAVAPDVVLIAKANAGIPHLEGGVPVYGATPEIMAAYATRVRSLGARIIGGCCGSTAAHMAAMSQALQAEAGS